MGFRWLLSALTVWRSGYKAFLHVALLSLDTQCLRSKCAVSCSSRKLNSAQVGAEYYTINSTRIATPPDLRCSYVPEDPVQVAVECGEFYVGRFSFFLYATQALRVSRGIALLFSRTFGTRRVWGESAPLPGRLYPRERPATHCTVGWVGPGAGLDGWKISSPPAFDPGPSSP